MFLAKAECRSNYERMRRAYRSDAVRAVLPAVFRQGLQVDLHDACLGVDAMKVSSSVREPAPSIGPRNVTLRAPAAQP